MAEARMSRGTLLFILPFALPFKLPFVLLISPCPLKGGRNRSMNDQGFDEICGFSANIARIIGVLRASWEAAKLHEYPGFCAHHGRFR